MIATRSSLRRQGTRVLGVLCLILVARSTAAGTAAIAIPEPRAADAAEQVLRAGGNAVDAAVATAFVLAVTLPDAGNIGGGGFMTLVLDNTSYFLDYRETAPAASERDMYLNEDGEVVDGASTVGHLAAGTPGTVAGLWEAHQRFGRLPWARLVEPAIRLARDGYPMPDWLAADIDASRGDYAGRTNFESYFGVTKIGETFRQPDLATTLTRIAEAGRDGFYSGQTADLIAAEMRRGGGRVTKADLLDYEVRWREPLRSTWRDYEIITAPLPSSGGFAIIQYLSMKDILQDAFSDTAHNSAAYIHLKSEIEKRIFADRARYFGDPDFVKVPLSKLLESDYLQRRAGEVNLEEPSPTPDVEPGLEPLHTTHFSILDSEGNAVSNTYTLNTSFGSGVVVEGGGFLLNNEMDDFAIAPGVPNYYGVVGDEANAIAPGKRMLSSMAPTILRRDGDIALVVGAMGGSTIFTTVYQLISNVIDYGMDVDAAQSAPRVHHQLLPDQVITYSPTTPLPDAAQDGLRALGYTVRPHAWEFGNAQLIWVADDGRTSAAADPRFAGVARVLTLNTPGTTAEGR